MLIALVLVLGAVVQVGSPAPTRPLTSDETAAAAPVHAAFERVRKAQAALPPPTTDAERLIRMRDLDQAGRAALVKLDVARLTPDGRKQVMATAWTEILRQDREDQKALLEMLPAEGWFTRSRLRCEAGELKPVATENPTDLDARRRSMGLVQPEAVYIQVAKAASPPCP